MVAFLLAISIAGFVSRLIITGGYIRSAGQIPENRNYARTDEEELVKAFILNNAEEQAEKVNFLTWGPHLDKRELLGLANEAGIVELADLFGPIEKKELKKLEAFKAIVRVRYEGPKTLAARRLPLFFLAPLQGDPDFLIPNRIQKIKTFDELYFVYAKLVVPLGSGGCDDWKLKLRKELSKRFPALKP